MDIGTVKQVHRNVPEPIQAPIIIPVPEKEKVGAK